MCAMHCARGLRCSVSGMEFKCIHGHKLVGAELQSHIYDVITESVCR